MGIAVISRYMLTVEELYCGKEEKKTDRKEVAYNDRLRVLSAHAKMEKITTKNNRNNRQTNPTWRLGSISPSNID